MEEEAQKDNGTAEKKKKLEAELLKNDKVNEIIDEKSNEIAQEKAQLLFKRNNFLNMVDGEPLSKLKKYRAVAKSDYEDLEYKIIETKKNIDKTSMEDLLAIETSLKSASNIEMEMENKLQNKDQEISAGLVKKQTFGAPTDLFEIEENPKAYSKYVDERMSYKGTQIFNTPTDDIKINMNLIGNRQDRSSIKEMNKLEESLEEILERNAPFKHYQQIL